MRAPTRGGKRERNYGVIAACAVAAAFMLLIGWFVMRGSPRTASAEGGTDPVASGRDVPDISEIQTGTGVSIDLTDKADPTKLIGVLTAESFQPVGVNERTVVQPRAWLYLKDGRFLHVQATSGRFFIPTGDEAPESGMLQGEEGVPVVIRLFAPTEDGRPPDPEGTESVLRFESAEPLEFDLRHARASTVGAFVVAAPELEFRGRYLTAVLNQVQQRLELVEVRHGESIRYWPDRRRDEDHAAGGAVAGGPGPRAATERVNARRDRLAPGEPGPGAAAVADAGAPNREVAPKDAGAAGGASASIAPAPKVDLYRAVFSDGVEVTFGEQRIAADALSLWARLIDNQLSEDAINELRFAARAEGTPGARAGAGEQEETARVRERRAGDEPRSIAHLTGPDPALDLVTGGSGPARTTGAGAEEGVGDGAGDVASVPAAGSAQPAVPPEPEGDERVITLRWTGPLQIVPLTGDAPAELASNDLLLRMTAERTGLVEFSDAASGARGRTVALDYGFTTTEMVFSGPGGNVELVMPGSGTLEASRMQSSLSAGTVHVRGPGVMAVESASGEEPRQRIRWSEQADFEFAVVDGELTSDLTRASFAGSVQANDREARLEGEGVSAEFVGTRHGTRRLSAVEVDGALALDGRGGTMAGQWVRVEFAEGTLGHDVDPMRLQARGRVRGSRDGSTLAAESVEATLGRDLDGDVSVNEVVATGQAEYQHPDGTFARGERIEADVIGETVTLTGEAASIGQGRTSIEGPEILVDGRNRRARVLGAGTFRHASEGERATDVVATWTEGMSFDDLGGRVEAFGGATATSRPDALTRDTVSAERILIELTPGDAGASPGVGGDASRRLVRAIAFGVEDAGGGVRPASVESRIFAADDPERVERLFYLEGMQLVADSQDERLTVPEAGKLLILDRRQNGAEERVNEEGGLLAELAQAGPGLTRFEWHGGMTMDRREGTAVMRQTVRVRHKNLLAGDFTELHCEKLTATIRETAAPGEGARTDAVRGELTQAEAAGAVYFKSGPRELIADRLLYDAVNGRAIATSAPGNQVSLFDAERATPVSSRAIYWDLIRDRVEIERLSPVVTPGNAP